MKGSREGGVGAWTGKEMGWMRDWGAHYLNGTHHCEAELDWEALGFHLTGNDLVRTQQLLSLAEKSSLDQYEGNAHCQSLEQL